MRYRNVNAVNIPVVGQGCMGIGGYFKSDAANDELYLCALREGIEYGATLLDTAEVYGAGHSEVIVGQAARGIRDKFIISTKFSPEHNSYHDVLKAADCSLQRLNTDYIDIYYIHWPNNAIPLEETMGALSDLVQAGKIRFAGVSNFSLSELKKARQYFKHELSFLQVEYNLFDRTIESDLLPFCRENNMLVVAYSPTDQGMIHLSDGQKNLLKSIGHKYEKTAWQIMLSWLTSQENIIAIPKSSNPLHAKENAVAADLELEKDDFEQINKHFPSEPAFIRSSSIIAVPDDTHGRKVYVNKQEAMDNEFGFEPSPAQLAEEMMADPHIKPIRVEQTGVDTYLLMEGRIRYWGWVIAYGDEVPVPCLVKNAK